MNDKILEISDNINEDHYNQIVEYIVAFNNEKIKHLNPNQFINKPLEIIVKNDVNEIIGGVYGRSIWGTIEVKTFVVKEEYRNQGIGKQLIQTLENEAKIRNCNYIILATFSFQAPDFYLKMGFVQTGIEKDFLYRVDKIYYRKTIKFI
jgi:GNAT superfamily N-acetyltransferase